MLSVQVVDMDHHKNKIYAEFDKVADFIGNLFSKLLDIEDLKIDQIHTLKMAEMYWFIAQLVFRDLLH